MEGLRFWGLPAALAVALSVGVILSRQVFWEGGRPVRVILVDDAMISMSSARSLAEGLWAGVVLQLSPRAGVYQSGLDDLHGFVA